MMSRCVFECGGNGGLCSQTKCQQSIACFRNDAGTVRHWADGRGFRHTATSTEGMGFVVALAKGRGTLRYCQALAFRGDCGALQVTYSLCLKLRKISLCFYQTGVLRQLTVRVRILMKSTLEFGASRSIVVGSLTGGGKAEKGRLATFGGYQGYHPIES